MSVLIKGMKMPETCNDCLICCEHSMLYLAITDKRSPKCPLVEIPTPHGRLIDGDELKTAFPRMDNSTDIKIHSVRATINHMPTVIEAEE